MSSELYFPCRLTKDNTILNGWISGKFATTGNILSVKLNNSFDDNWKIEQIGPPESFQDVCSKIGFNTILTVK